MTTAPGLSKTTEEHRQVINSPEYQKLRQMYSKIDISVSGVGSIYPRMESPLLTSGYLSEEEIAEISRENAVCDCLLRFFNEKGEECDSSLKDRTVAIPVEEYKKIPTRIVVASGKGKAHAVTSLLKGNMLDVLIIDRELAEAVDDLN